MKRIVRSPLIAATLGWLIWAYMALCGRTIRWKVEGLDAARDNWQEHHSVIVAAWHSTILTLPTAWTRYMRRWPGRNAGSAMLISLSPDGEPVAQAIRHLGLLSVRGSSARKSKNRDKGGGAAIAEASRLLKAGGAVCITPDGPRGPRQRAGMGPIVIAKRTKSVILPYALATAPSKRLSTWDRFQIPIPFARGAIVFGEPILPDEEATSESLRLTLENRLNAATYQAEALCGADHVSPADITPRPQKSAGAT